MTDQPERKSGSKLVYDKATRSIVTVQTDNTPRPEIPIEDDDIHPFNGVSGTPQDRLANGCMWVIGAVMGTIIFFALLGFGIELWSRI